MSATIETIANMVGCSVATVSRVINNIEPVSKPMRKAILQAMRETNYTPRRKSSPRQGVDEPDMPGLVDVLLHWRGALEHYSFPGGRINVDFVDSCEDNAALNGTERIANSFFRSVVDGICAELPLWNLRPVLQTATDLFSPLVRKTLQQGGVQGLVIAGSPSERMEEFLQEVGRPVVLADIPSGCGCPMVTVDSRRGIELAFEHVYSLGHRRIGFLLSLTDNPIYTERFSSFRFCMNSAGLPVHQEWVYRGYNQVAAAAEWARTLFAVGDYPTAFISASDIPALGVLRAASEMGINVPQKVSLVGFDDIDAASVVTPPLTSVRVPAMDIGREAARQLVLQIKAERTPQGARKVILEPELIIRSSTAPLME